MRFQAPVGIPVIKPCLAAITPTHGAPHVKSAPLLPLLRPPAAPAVFDRSVVVSNGFIHEQLLSKMEPCTGALVQSGIDLSQWFVPKVSKRRAACVIAAHREECCGGELGRGDGVGG